MTRGLVLGKFAPFHRGHQLLVERSLAETDETVVLIYDAPETTRVPLDQRAGWIRALYPAARVIEGHRAPSATGRDPAIMRLQEDYIRGVVPAPITHFFSSEWYGAHVSAALGAVDRRVDEARGVVPISGTEMRRSPYENRAFVHPLVYRDLIRRVVLLGAESTGKSTLARALAKRLSTQWMHEYGREFWEQHHDGEGRLSGAQLTALAHGHREREELATREANRLLFVDTDARTTRQYCRWYHHGIVPPALERIAEECGARYHLTVLCDADIPYVDDGTRAGTLRRQAAQAEIVAELVGSTAPMITVRGSLSERVEQVAGAIHRMGLSNWS